jgi:nicotinate-nucleotide adenylyltransferase
VWWLVSPQNPLKPADGMAPLAERLHGAQRAAHHSRLVVTDVECVLGTRQTADTLAGLTARFPRTRFVWLMGADNLVQIRRWHHWHRIFTSVPIAVHDRPSYSFKALRGLAAQRYARRRIAPDAAGRLAGMEPPTWVFLQGRRHPASATALRAARRSRRQPSNQGEVSP